MISLIALLTCLQLFSSNNCQPLNFSEALQESQRLRNKAEIAACNHNYLIASSAYDSLFKLKIYHFTRDFYNWALCEKKLSKFNKADSLLQILYIHGLLDQHGSNCLDTSGSYIEKRKKQNELSPLIKTLDEILQSDQKSNAGRYADMENYLNTVITNTKRIKALIEDRNRSNYLEISLIYSKVSVVITHYYQFLQLSRNPEIIKRMPIYECVSHIDFEKHGFDEFLVAQTEKGLFDSQKLAGLYAILGYDFGQTVISQYNNYVVILDPTKVGMKYLEKINESRLAFGLESFQDHFKKAAYQDSIQMNGETFAPIQNGQYSSLINDFNNKCTFRFSQNWRSRYDFTTEAGARKMYNEHMKKIKSK